MTANVCHHFPHSQTVCICSQPLYVGTLSVGACVQLDCVHYRKLDYEDESSVAYPSYIVIIRQDVSFVKIMESLHSSFKAGSK